MSGPPTESLAAQWQAICDALVQGLDVALPGPQVAISRRMTWRLGAYRPDRHLITLSYWLVTEHEAEAVVTLKHELAHALAMHRFPGCQPHGVEWRQACQLLAVPPQRCSDLPRLGPRVRSRRRYLYLCPACGQQILYGRRLRISRSCGKCDRRYNPRFRLRFVAEIPAPSERDPG